MGEIWLSGGHAMSGRVRLNHSYFSTSTYNHPEWRNIVMCQEVGHTFGLGHQDETFGNANLGSCMDYSSNQSSTHSRRGWHSRSCEVSQSGGLTKVTWTLPAL